MARHRHALTARDELEHRPRRDRPDVLPGGRDTFAVDEARALEVLRDRYEGVCSITVRAGKWYAGRNGEEVDGDNPDELVQAIFIAWGAR